MQYLCSYGNILKYAPIRAYIISIQKQNKILRDMDTFKI